MSAFIEQGKRFSLTDPTLLPNSAGYLWNRQMMIHVNCQGYAVAQYMNPEPKKYTHVPNLAATSFMQPEQPYFAHHPGRFFYVRDDQTGELFSAPFAPMKSQLDYFSFQPGLSDVKWKIKHQDIELEITLTLGEDSVAELWHVNIVNKGENNRKLSLIPYFPVGYSSWMNMEAHYDKSLNAIICTSITPYQMLEDYQKNKHLKDITFFACDVIPDHFETSLPRFEGQGGLHNPSALQNFSDLSDKASHYEMPICSMQFKLDLSSSEDKQFNFVFGPAIDKQEVAKVISEHSGDNKISAIQAYQDYIASGTGVIEIDSPDQTLNHFVNHWLPRQVYYHGDTNRLTTDPQTRNYLQDGMGMAYVKSDVTRQVILTSLAQQKADGEMPDGILLTPEASFKYINQIPHTDHSVWLAIILDAYLNETNDWAILDKKVTWKNDQTPASVLEHINRAMKHMCDARDHRGLPFIAQGDWCDPMNMVGPKGKGVSGWLAQALSFALQTWIKISKAHNNATIIEEFEQIIASLTDITNQYLWKGDWYARGITDDDVTFGVPEDKEGRIFINTQSWAFLAGIPDALQKEKMLKAIDEQLDTPFGVMLCAPAFTKMREDVGRVTQKWPGSGENGSVYNHASAFYAASLYTINEADRAFSILRKMIADPNHKDFEQRGQLPVYIPNYYRGAYYQFPDTAGRSSNLFNTGTGAWVYRMLIEEMLGLKGCVQGLKIEPKLPSSWPKLTAKRQFRGAILSVIYQRSAKINDIKIEVDGIKINDNILTNIISGRHYQILITLPVVDSK